MKLAVIDLGTNTFNILVAEIIDQQYKILFQDKVSVKLGRGGIQKNLILPDALGRAMDALFFIKKQIDILGVDKTIAIGTSALRTAENSSEFIEVVSEKLNINISVISGEREAELIFYGVNMSLKEVGETCLILDIGGGSNEFIISRKNEILWRESFPLGMARLNERFLPSNPIRTEELVAMRQYFEESLQSLFDAVRKFPVSCLVGAEGAFESFYNYIHYKSDPYYKPKYKQIAVNIALKDFNDFFEFIVKTTTEERQNIKGIEPFRVEMVVPAAIFVKFILDRLSLSKILVSGNSLKDGVLYEELKKKAV